MKMLLNVQSVVYLLWTCFLRAALGDYQWENPRNNPWDDPHILGTTGLMPPSSVPFFEYTSTSIAVRPGQTVQIPCRVRSLGDKVVSWIRSRDLHILSSGELTFTADPRFAVMHPDGDSAAWTLQLKKARLTDQGLYECQVNTEPKMKHIVHLSVSDIAVHDPYDVTMKDDSNAGAVARILGPAEQYVRVGSTVTLTCEVRGLTAVRLPPPTHHHAKPTRLIDWIYEGQFLTYQAARGGISIDTERTEDLTYSRLTLASVKLDDMGRYTCKPITSAPPAIVTLLVIEGERSEAMQRDEINDASLTESAALVHIITLCLWLLHS